MTPVELGERMTNAARTLGGVWQQNGLGFVRMRPENAFKTTHCPVTAICEAEKDRFFTSRHYARAAEAAGIDELAARAVADAADMRLGGGVDIDDYRAVMLEVVGS